MPMNKRLREKKQYLLKKEQELREKELAEKKKKVIESIDSKTRIPHCVRSDATDVLNDYIYNVDMVDRAPLPKVLITTSKNPSSKLLQFSKHLSLVLNGHHVMRGSMTERCIGDMAHAHRYTAVIVLYETSGKPSSLTLSIFPYGPTMRFNLCGVVSSNRTTTMPEKAYFIADSMAGEREIAVKDVFAGMFPRCDSARRVLALADRNGVIAFRHYMICSTKKTELNVDLSFDMILYEIREGTFDQDGEVEWALRFYQNGFTNKEAVDV